jgi:N-methylhydantoinase B/oxoprolinase/acetone carboxylase alpha subunit
MNDAAAAPDPITLEILHNALRSVVDESFIALMKSAYSTNIKERHDHSTALLDRNGRLIAQAELSLPIHLSSMMGMMQVVVAKYPPGALAEGDILVGNDPYAAGGTHLPDVGLVMPIFVRGAHVGYVANLAHHADIGGMAPGSMAGGMTEIYQEGLRIPVIHLFRSGELVQDVLDLLLLNQRVPEERRGDYFAQVAACRLGERRLRELAEIHSIATLDAAFDAIVMRTRQRMRSAFAAIPAGVYEAEDVMDDDGLAARNLPIKCRITVGDGHMTLDFTGTASQVPGNINCTLNATQAASSYTLKALLDPDVPNNQGVLDAYTIVTEKGTIVDCVFPASVAARAHVCQRIVDVIIRALADAVPQLAVGAANGANTTAVFTGADPRNGNTYVYLETLGGGFGGRQGRRASPHHQHLEPAGRGDRDGVPADRGVLFTGRRFRRCRKISRRTRIAPRDPTRRPCRDLLRSRRTLPQRPLGNLRRQAGPPRPLHPRRTRRHRARTRTQTARRHVRSGRARHSRNTGRRRLRRTCGTRSRSDRARSPRREVQRGDAAPRLRAVNAPHFVVASSRASRAAPPRDVEERSVNDCRPSA